MSVSSSSNSMRMYGLNSGIDYSSWVDQLMAAERAPQDRLKQKQTTLQWTEDAYRAMNTAFSTFQGQIQNLQYSSGWKLQTSTSSNTSIASVSVSGNATAGSHSVNVTQLATGASIVMGSGITANPGLQGNDLTSSLPVTITAGSNDQLNITLNGVQKTVSMAAGTYSSISALQSALQSAVNNAFTANQITVGTNGNTLTLTPNGASGYLPQLTVNAAGSNTGISALGFTAGQTYKVDPTATFSSQTGSANSKLGSAAFNSGSFTINGQTISYTGADSINSIIQNVNSSAAGVTMTYDSVTDTVSFNSTQTGVNAQINVGSDSGSLFSVLKIASNVNTATLSSPLPANVQSFQKGQNAIMTVDGVQTQQASNAFTLNGVSYTLSGVGSTTVNVTSDSAGLTKQITDFVNNYNTLIQQLSTKLNEPKYNTYPPLTDSQAAQLSNSQIASYNQKAMSGLLRNDDILQTVYDNFRLSSYQSVGGTSTYHALYDIGITSSSYSTFQNDPTKAGQLQVDTSKLQQALATNPNDVFSIMESLTQQLNSTMTTAITGIIGRAGITGTAYDSSSTTIGTQVSGLEQQISDWDSRLNAMQQNYIQQFAQMDTAVGQNNQQLTWLQNAFK